MRWGEGGAFLKVLMVGRHTVCREGLAVLLGSCPGVVVAPDAPMAEDAASALEAVRPDVLLASTTPSKEAVLHLCEVVRASSGRTALVVLSSEVDPWFVRETVGRGVAGYVLETSGSRELFRAIHHVGRGERYLDPAVQNGLLPLLDGDPEAERSGLAALTDTERRILSLVTEGRTNRSISRELGYAESTVKNYVSRIFRKLGVASRTEAAALTLQQRRS